MARFWSLITMIFTEINNTKSKQPAGNIWITATHYRTQTRFETPFYGNYDVFSSSFCIVPEIIPSEKWLCAMKIKVNFGLFATQLATIVWAKWREWAIGIFICICKRMDWSALLVLWMDKTNSRISNYVKSIVQTLCWVRHKMRRYWLFKIR